MPHAFFPTPGRAPAATARVSPRFRARAIGLGLAALLAAPFVARAWTPGTGAPDAVSGFSVNTTDRRDVLAYYQTVYRASEGYAERIDWTGDVAAGIPGTTSAIFKEDVRRRINFYRALVGLPADIVFDATKSAKDQEAALMFAANDDIDHTPPTTWTHYTANGAEAAVASNIAIGVYGPGSVDAYIRDNGANNTVVGHRRWLHYSRAQIMGTGDVPFGPDHNATNAIWVIGNFKSAPSPAPFIAWPNPGYSPIDLTPARWSLSYPGANFASATVTMSQGGTPVSVTIISATTTGVGDNSIVWEPQGLPAPGTLSADRPYSITVSGIGGAGVPASHTYSVTLFDPDVLGESIAVQGPAEPPTSGAAYTFNTIDQADAYELEVATFDPSAWIEGAEDVSAGLVIDDTAAGYSLRQSAVVRGGAKAFQLTFPDFTEPSQSFELDRDIVVSATSELRFYDRFRFVTTASRLSAELSADGGLNWTELWGRNGNGNTSSAGWDTAFNARTIDLAAYAGQIVRVRFVFRHNNSAFLGTGPNTGVFIDDIDVKGAGAGRLLNSTRTPLGAAATGFTLDATTAGAPLADGTTYYLRVRPEVGTRWFDFGDSTIITARALSGFALYVATQYPELSGVPADDHDADGLADLVEYAFGTDPTAPTPGTALPAVQLAGGEFFFAYSAPAGVTGLSYGAQVSYDLVTWSDLPDTGTAGAHRFATLLAGHDRVFLRHRITLAP